MLKKLNQSKRHRLTLRTGLDPIVPANCLHRCGTVSANLQISMSLFLTIMRSLPFIHDEQPSNRVHSQGAYSLIQLEHPLCWSRLPFDCLFVCLAKIIQSAPKEDRSDLSAIVWYTYHAKFWNTVTFIWALDFEEPGML